MNKRLPLLTLIITVNFSFAQDTSKTKENDAAPSQSKEFKPSGKVWGFAFGDFYYKAHADSANRGSRQYSGIAKDQNAFDLRRIYFGYNYEISEKFSAELILAHEGDLISNSNRGVYVKSAHVKWKSIFRNNDLIIGQQVTPTWSISENIWGYRSVERTVADLGKAGISYDLGVGLQGKFLEGRFGYNLLFGNGTSAKLENDKFKKMYGEFYGKFLNKRLLLDVYADYERTKLLPDYHKSKTTLKALIVWQQEWITAGIEIFQQAQTNNAMFAEPLPSSTIDTVDMSLVGYSFFIRGPILKNKLGYFIRYDLFNPDTKFIAEKTYIAYSAYSTERFFLAGIDYTPHKNIHIIPNIWYASYTNRKKGVSGLNKSDYDMVYRMTFHFIFK